MGIVSHACFTQKTLIDLALQVLSGAGGVISNAFDTVNTWKAAFLVILFTITSGYMASDVAS